MHHHRPPPPTLTLLLPPCPNGYRIHRATIYHLQPHMTLKQKENLNPLRKRGSDSFQASTIFSSLLQMAAHVLFD